MERMFRNNYTRLLGHIGRVVTPALNDPQLEGRKAVVAATKVQPYMSCLWGKPWRLWRLLKKAGWVAEISGRVHTDLDGKVSVSGLPGRPRLMIEAPQQVD